MNRFTVLYKLKKLMPRSLQIETRRAVARGTRTLCRGRWPIDRRSGRSPKGFTGWPDGRDFALVLRHDVETAFGMDNCAALLDLEHSYGMRSCFYFVPEDYSVDGGLRERIVESGGEVGVHGLHHDGMLYRSRTGFREQAARINQYLQSWNAVGFASPSSHHRFDWLHELNILYDTSSFDTDPFEPQPDGIRTIFPMEIRNQVRGKSFIELPYTLPQDFTLFVILQAKDTEIWKRKLDWIARRGGMAMVTTHPDYMHFPKSQRCRFSYPSHFYEELLAHVDRTYRGQYWAALPREVAAFWRSMEFAHSE